jgi:hypothetical protein
MHARRMQTRLARVSSLLLLFAVVAAAPARAQDPPPRLPLFVVDVHGTMPRFPSDSQGLVDSRGLNSLAELPGTGLGLQAGLHLYPLRFRVISVGIGGEVVTSRAKQTPATGSVDLRPTEEHFRSIAPQLSFNFGNGHGWSYLSGGIGRSNWQLKVQGAADSAADTEPLKTINYGGGARWFIRPHVAFSFDVRFYAINPGTPDITTTGSPRTTLLVIGAGVSVK